MIHKLSWKMNKLSGIPFEDIRSEAYDIFMTACKSYSPDKGTKFTSWCYFKIWTRLQHYLRSRAKDRLTFVEEIKDEMLPPPDVSTLRASLEEQFADLSPDAKKLIDIIIQKAGPEPQNPQELLREACDELCFENGQDKVYVDIVVHEIKAELAGKIK